MNKDLIIKNLSGILCAICVLALVLPFCSASVSANVAGYSADSEASVNGIKMVTSGLWGILFLVGLVAVLAAAYVKQLGVYKKIVQLIASGVMVLTLFMSPAAALSSGAEAGGDSASVDIDISYGIGFWIMLICSLALAGLAVISFFQLKGNVVFDTINADNDGTPTQMNTPDFGAAAQRIGDFTKNIAGNFNKRAENGNVAVAQQPVPMAQQPMNPIQQGAPVAQQPAPMPQHPMNPVRQGAPVAQQPAPMPQQPMNPARQGAPVAQQPAPMAQQPMNPARQGAPVAQQSAPMAQQPVNPVRQGAPAVQQPIGMNADYYMEQLEKLFAMKEKGILTEEEFSQKKKEYLKKM